MQPSRDHFAPSPAQPSPGPLHLEMRNPAGRSYAQRERTTARQRASIPGHSSATRSASQDPGPCGSQRGSPDCHPQSGSAVRKHCCSWALPWRTRRQRQCEGSSPPRSVAMNAKRPAKFFSCNGAAMQTEAMPGAACRETMRKNAGQMLRPNSDPVIHHLNGSAFGIGRKDADDEALVMTLGSAQGVLGVADEINKNLQHFMFVQHQRRNRSHLRFEPYFMPIQSRLIDLNGILHELRNFNTFLEARDLRVTLLHRHDLIDVLDILAKLAQLTQQKLLVLLQRARRHLQIFRNALAPGVRG